MSRIENEIFSGAEVTALAPLEPEAFMPALSIQQAVERFNSVVEFVRTVMREGVDYGRIPGTDKPTLLKPGAEKLCTLFGLSTRFQLINCIEDWNGSGHQGEPFFYYLYRCQLWRGNLVIAEGDGSCNSFEQKYRYRDAQRKCPACGAAAIIRGKEEYGGGLLCLTPETPILYSDFVWRPIGEAKPGDVIFGFDEYPTEHKFGRKMRPAMVESVWFSRQQTQRLITAHSDVLTTAQHKWLQHHKVPGHRGHWGDPWMQTDRLIVGNCLRNINHHEAPLVTDDYRAGYLAGITIGDGTFRYVEGATRAEQKTPYWRVALRETDEAALGRIVAYLAAFKIEAHVRAFNRGVTSVTPTGGLYPSELHPMKKVEIRSMGRLEAIYNVLKTKDTLEFKRGFLAGFFDAEGSGEEGRGGHVRVSQKDTSVLHLVAQYGASLGFKFNVTERDNTSCSVASLHGGFLERLRFMSTCQPVLTRKAGVVGTSVQYDPSEIVAIEPGPMEDVVDIQTSTGTFFAAGLATHNCFKKKGGCGLKFDVDDPRITSQPSGRVPNENIADQVNTIQKMGQKRALISATLLAVNGSEFFTQDTEDMIITVAPSESAEARAAAPAASTEAPRQGPPPHAASAAPAGPERRELVELCASLCRSLKVEGHGAFKDRESIVKHLQRTAEVRGWQLEVNPPQLKGLSDLPPDLLTEYAAVLEDELKARRGPASKAEDEDQLF